MQSLGPSGGMVDAGDSKSPAARRAGSSPALGTNSFLKQIQLLISLRRYRHDFFDQGFLSVATCVATFLFILCSQASLSHALLRAFFHAH